MTLFFVLACLLVVAALAAIIPSALRARHSQSDPGDEELNQLDTNISIARERRANLENARANGTIDQATFDTELADLENGLAIDLSTERSASESARSGLVIAALITVFLPIASGALYLHLGTPEGVNVEAMHDKAVAAQQQPQETAPPALTELLPNLEKKLEANPDDVAGWKLLGKSYLTIGEFDNAKRALVRAYNLDKSDPELLAQLAEATAMERGGDLSGQATDYIDSALALNPEHQQSLWLKAIATQQAQNHEEAITRFEALRAGVAGNPEAQASIDEMMNQSKMALGQQIESSPSSAVPSINAEQNKPDVSNASLSVTVDLAEHVKADTAPTDSVFIFARASSGPPMPLAVSRHTVSELPITVVLDDTMAMIPAMTLSKFPSVTVGARVSKSGDAIAKAGDWFTEKNEVDVTTTDALTLTIDQQK